MNNTPEAMLNSQTKIAFIGGGNMAKAILSGLIKHGHPRNNLMVTAPSSRTRNEIANYYYVNTEFDNTLAVDFADVIILAVKPTMVAEVCEQLREQMNALQKSPLIISVAAGVSVRQISEGLGGADRIVCAMPNLPSSICKGLTGLYAEQGTSLQDSTMADEVMRAVGETVWLGSETQMPSIVAAAGSSPAYFFLFMEAMEKAAIEQGLDPEVAKTSVLQSALGAVSMAIRTEQPLKDLREKVTSPKGSTEQAIASFRADNIDSIVADAMTSAADRVNEIYKYN